MTRTTTSTTTIATVPGTDIELSLELNTDQDESDMFFKVMPDRVIVGYLAHDQDCSDPCKDQDGNGKIHRAGGSSSEDYQAALGLNSDYQPNLTIVSDEAVMRHLLEDIRLSFSGKDAQKLYGLCKEFCDDVCSRNPDEGTLEFVLRGIEQSGLDDLGEFLDLEPYGLAAWTEGRLNGTIGTKYAVLLDVYEHGGVSYSISGEGVQCRFDTSRGGAVWVPDSCAVENFEDKALTYEENFVKAKNYAKGCVSEYTLWANGECYGHVVEKHEDGIVEQLDACWGYIGASYAKEQCKEAFDYQVKEIEDVSVPQPAAPDA